MTLPNAPIPEARSRLAWELVAKISPLPDILRRHNLTVTQLKQMMREPMFRSLMAETKKLWESELNAKERIRVKARLLVEDSILDIYQIVQNVELNPNARIDAFEQLAKIGELAAPEKNPTSNERVQITINIPGTDKPVVINAERGNDDERTIRAEPE